MRKRVIYGLLLFSYTAVVYWLTNFSRNPYPQASSDWRPFWTYGAIADGRDELIGEVFSNVLMFMTVGAFIGLMIQASSSGFSKKALKTEKCWNGWLLAFIGGTGLSLGIELLQLYLRRGLCETDDIIHNTIGCLIGFVLIKILSRVFRKPGIIQDI